MDIRKFLKRKSVSENKDEPDSKKSNCDKTVVSNDLNVEIKCEKSDETPTNQP